MNSENSLLTFTKVHKNPLPSMVRQGCVAMFALLFSIAALAAASLPIPFPALVDPSSQEHHVGKVIFVELVTPDLAASKAFYSAMFGWTYQTLNEGAKDYAIASLNGRIVAGMFHKAQPTDMRKQPMWLNFMAVRDADVARSLTVQQGGKVLFEPHNFPNRGREAVFMDPQGAVFAVLASSSGDPEDELAEPGEWIWSSLITTDPDANAAFYQTIFDYEVFDLPTEESAAHLILSTENFARASVNTLPANSHKMHPHWINYLRVDDTVKMTEKLVALGGRVLVEPRIDRHGGKVVLVADPLGTPFGMIEWSGSMDEEAAK